MSPGGGTARATAGGDRSTMIRATGLAHLERVEAASERFFEVEADAISEACRAMAKRFRLGGRLLAIAEPACASDADHVAVEFVHPVIVGKRALPAIALPVDGASSSNASAAMERRLRLLARPHDIALGITTAGRAPEVIDALRTARELGLLVIGLAGRPPADAGEEGSADFGGEPLDHRFVVPDHDPTVVQEVQETLYHVLWELVHVFFEEEALS